jgi:hypothetical protein
MRPRNTRKIPTWVANTVASTEGWNAGVKTAMQLMSQTLALDSAIRRSELVRLLSEDNLLDAGAVRMEINTLTRVHNTLVQDLNDLLIGERVKCPCQLLSGSIPRIRELLDLGVDQQKNSNPKERCRFKSMWDMYSWKSPAKVCVVNIPAYMTNRARHCSMVTNLMNAYESDTALLDLVCATVKPGNVIVVSRVATMKMYEQRLGDRGFYLSGTTPVSVRAAYASGDNAVKDDKVIVCTTSMLETLVSSILPRQQPHMFLWACLAASSQIPRIAKYPNCRSIVLMEHEQPTSYEHNWIAKAIRTARKALS